MTKYRYFYILSVLLSVLFCGFFSEKARASIIYSHTDQFIASTSWLDAPNCNGSCNASSSVIGVADNAYMDASTTASFKLYFLKAFGPSGLPTNAIVDAIWITTHATGTISMAITSRPNCNGSSGSNGTGNTYTSTPNFYTFISDISNQTPAFLACFTPATIDTDNSFISLGRSTAANRWAYDSIERQIFYHYDTSGLATRLINTAISPLNTLVYPPLAVSTSTITSAYYYSSLDDLATSTKYTQLEYQLLDYNTNQYAQLLTGSITKDTLATTTIANFCGTGAFNCTSGDTYSLSVRFSNADNTVRSAFFGTSPYFSYIATSSPLVIPLTHFNTFSYSTTTGKVSMGFYIATSSSPVLLSLDETNDRDGQLAGQPVVYPFPIGNSTTSATVIIPSDPANSGTTYLTASLVSQTDRTNVFDTRAISIRLATTSASSTPITPTAPTYTPAECGITNLGGCFQNALCAIFCPSQGSLAIFTSFITVIQSKPPAGYFYIIKNNLNNISTSTNPTFTLTIPQHFKDIVFTPFDIAISSILWFFFGINFYKRLKHITV